MFFLKTVGLRTYYSVRRLSKALRNWRKFGIIIFGSFFVASTFMPFATSADDLRVEIYKGNLSPSSISIDEGDFIQFSAKAFLGNQDVTTQTSFLWSTNGLFSSSDVGYIDQSGLYTTGETEGFYSGALRLVGTYDGKADLDTVSVTINSVTPPIPTISLDRVEILDTNNLALSSFSIDEDSSKQFKAIAYDTNGNDITTQTSFLWSTNGLFSSSDVGYIDQSGLYTTGETEGFYSGALRLVGTYDGKADLDTVSVTINSVTPPIPTISLDRVEILDTNNLALSSFSIDEDSSKQFKAIAYDTNGNDITTQTSFLWSTNGLFSSSDVGYIDQSGLYTTGETEGFYSGALRLVGTYDGKADLDTVSVTINSVTPPIPTISLDRVEILDTNNLALSSFSIDEDSSKQFKAIAYDTNGNDITTQTSFLWSTNGLFSSSDVGYIDQSGLYTAGDKEGFYFRALRLVGTYDGKADLDTVSVTINSVTPPIPTISLDRVEILDTNNLALSSFSIDEDSSKQFKAIAYDTNGNDITTQTSFDWDVANSYIGVISPNGYFTSSNNAGFYSGAISLIGVYNGKSDLDLVSVLVNEIQPTITLNRIEIIPSSITLDQESNYQFTARAYDQDDNLLTSGVSYSWAVVNSGGTVSSAGLFTAGSIDGTFSDTVRVRAIMDNNIVYDYATVIVNPIIIQATLDRVEIIPPSIIINQNTNYQFTARAYDQDDNLLTSGVSYSWAVVNSGGTVSSAGLFTAGSIDGTFSDTVRVRAIMDNNIVYDYATVIVNPIIIQATLDRVEILPASISLSPNQVFDFDAQAYDTNNSPMFNNVTYSWNVIFGPGTVNQNGLFVSSSNGTATIQATALAGGVQRYDTATVNISGGVVIGDLHHVVIDPQIIYLEPGESADFDAQSYDVNGNSIYATYTWNSTNSTAGSVSQNGYFTANYTIGTYYNAVKVKAYRNGIERYDYADVIVRDSGSNDIFNINADLHVVDENGGSAYPLDILHYTLTLTNQTNYGATGRLYNVRSTLNLPDYVTFISATSLAGGAGINSRTIIWEAGTLQYGETKTLNLRVRINNDVPKGKIIFAKAYVNADQLDNGFWVYANDITIVGGSTNDNPLTPTGAWQWALAIIMAMLATVLTRQLFRTKQLLKHRI